MRKFSVNTKHAGRPDSSLILEITIHESCQVETAEIPNHIEDVVHCAADRVVGAED